MSRLPLPEIKQRITTLQERLSSAELDGALILEKTDLFYLSGTGQNACLFVPTQGEPLLMVRKDVVRATEETPLKNIIPLNSIRELSSLLSSKGSGLPKRLGMELDVLPVNEYRRYELALPGVEEILDLSGIMREIRMVKSELELSLIRDGASRHSHIFEEASRVIRPGAIDLEISAHLDAVVRRNGHLDLIRFRGFNQELCVGHVFAGANGAVPSCYDIVMGGQGLTPAFPQGACGQVITEGVPVMVDYVGNYHGYHVDQTRTMVIGQLSSKLQHALETSMEINATLASLGRPGVFWNALYTTAVKLAQKAGHGEHFMGCVQQVSFVGHGVGLEINELPVIARGFEKPLVKGMVLALEPKFIFPGLGAVGVEDTFVVTDHGLEKLTHGSCRLVTLEG